MSSVEQGPVAVITHESVSDRMAGPGIRTWEISRALGKHGVHVILATPFESSRQAENVEICTFSWDDPPSLARLVDRAQAVIAMGPVLARVLHLRGEAIAKPTIVDVYYVPEVEHILLALTLGQSEFDPTNVFREDMFAYLQQGDFFLAATDRQYDFWLGALLAVGRLNVKALAANWNVDALIDIVPLGVPDEDPVAGPRTLKGVIPGIRTTDKVIYWGGGIWDWNDPFTLLNALKIVLKQRDDVRVVFGALHHFERKVVPEMSIAARLMEYVQREGWQDKYVFFRDWIPYDQRVSYLMEADIGVSLNHRTLENRYAVRARILDCLWARLPCILSQGDDSAQLLERAGLAQLVQPGDAAHLAQVTLQILGDEGMRARLAVQATPFVDQLRWSSIVQPILRFLRAPYLAPDATESRNKLQQLIPLRREWDQLLVQNRTLEGENQSLRIELERFRQRRAVRFADTASRVVATFRPRR